MNTRTELNIMKLLVTNLTSSYTIREISKRINQNYSIVYTSINSLAKEGHIEVRKIGNVALCSLSLKYSFLIYLAEEYRKTELINTNKTIKGIYRDIKRLDSPQFILILFGSYVEGKQSKTSDIDLLFILPDCANIDKWEQHVKKVLILYEDKIDVNIVTEKSMFEMWGHPKKLNVGNEILENHIILNGAESFYKLLEKR